METNEGHNHYFMAFYDSDGRVQYGCTSENDGHSHRIKLGTATEEQNGHAHRIIIS